VKVIFARGTGEPAGPGWLGKAFTRALRSKVAPKSVELYAVNYPASRDFRSSVPVGAADVRSAVASTSASCPATKLILGGYSQGAGVIDLVTIAAPVNGYTPQPLPAEDAGHVSAVVVFGNAMREMPGGGSLQSLSPSFGNRTLDLCADGDIYCARGLNPVAHFTYAKNGMVDQAVTFAAAHL
jgi:cutinase